MYKKYVVRLTEEEREQIEKLVRRGRAHARSLLYGRILLKADADGPDRWTDERIADALGGFHGHGGAGETPLRGGRAGGGAHGKEARQAQKAGPGRSGRGAPGGAILLGAAGGTGKLDAEVAGRPDGRARARGGALPRDPVRRTLKKTPSDPIWSRSG